MPLCSLRCLRSTLIFAEVYILYTTIYTVCINLFTYYIKYIIIYIYIYIYIYTYTHIYILIKYILHHFYFVKCPGFFAPDECTPTHRGASWILAVCGCRCKRCQCFGTEKGTACEPIWMKGSTWLNMAQHGLTWVNMRYQWLSMVINGYQLLSLDINGYQWLSIFFDCY